MLLVSLTIAIVRSMLIYADYAVRTIVTTTIRIRGWNPLCCADEKEAWREFCTL